MTTCIAEGRKARLSQYGPRTINHSDAHVVGHIRSTRNVAVDAPAVEARAATSNKRSGNSTPALPPVNSEAQLQTARYMIPKDAT